MLCDKVYIEVRVYHSYVRRNYTQFMNISN